jgi:hypothetical protein
MLQRGIRQADVVAALMNGEVIEPYTDDYPHPSCLVLGSTVANHYIHVVCGFDNVSLWLITAYCPDTDKWLADLKTRRERRQ